MPACRSLHHAEASPIATARGHGRAWSGAQELRVRVPAHAPRAPMIVSYWGEQQRPSGYLRLWSGAQQGAGACRGLVDENRASVEGFTDFVQGCTTLSSASWLPRKAPGRRGPARPAENQSGERAAGTLSATALERATPLRSARPLPAAHGLGSCSEEPAAPLSSLGEHVLGLGDVVVHGGRVEA